MSVSSLEDLAQKREVVRPLYLFKKHGKKLDHDERRTLFREMLALEVATYWVEGTGPTSALFSTTSRGDELLEKYGPVTPDSLVREYITPEGGSYRDGWEGTINDDLMGRSVYRRDRASSPSIKAPVFFGSVTGIEVRDSAIHIQVRWDPDAVNLR